MFYFYFRSGCCDFVRVSNLTTPLSAQTFGEYNPCNCKCKTFDYPFVRYNTN